MRKMFSKNQIGEIAKQYGVFLYYAQLTITDEESSTIYDSSEALLLSKDPNLQIIEGDFQSPVTILQLNVANDDDTYYAVNPELTLMSDYFTFTDGGMEDIRDPLIEYTFISKIM